MACAEASVSASRHGVGKIRIRTGLRGLGTSPLEGGSCAARYYGAPGNPPNTAEAQPPVWSQHTGVVGGTLGPGDGSTQ